MTPSPNCSRLPVPTTVLLSIKPPFANAILSGTKRFEFRRAVFRNPEVNRIVIYASSPVQRVIGEFRVDGVLDMELESLWAATCQYAGIERSFFDRYFCGRESGYALKVDRPRRYRSPLSLSADLGITAPPQSFCYLD